MIKKILFAFIMLFSMTVTAQDTDTVEYRNDSVYIQSSEFSFYTVEHDTLFLDMDHYITPQIVKIWSNDQAYNGIKPVIVLLSLKQFNYYMYKREQYFAKCSVP